MSRIHLHSLLCHTHHTLISNPLINIEICIYRTQNFTVLAIFHTSLFMYLDFWNLAIRYKLSVEEIIADVFFRNGTWYYDLHLIVWFIGFESRLEVYFLCGKHIWLDLVLRLVVAHRGFPRGVKTDQ